MFIGECEQRITDLRARIPAQQNTIRTRRSEKQRLEGEAQRLRAEADSAAIRGQNGMQLGLGNNSRRLLEEGELEIWKKYVKLITINTAERKMREAMTKDREAKDLERLALEGERNIHRLR